MDEEERDAMVEGWLRNVVEPDPIKFPEEYKQWTWLQKLAVMKQMRDEMNRRGERLFEIPGAEESVRAGEALYQQLVDMVE